MDCWKGALLCLEEDQHIQCTGPVKPSGGGEWFSGEYHRERERESNAEICDCPRG